MPHDMMGVGTTAPELENALYRKVTWRIIPLLFACYVAAYLDRVNVGFARLQMLSDLGFSETVYGLGAGIFFIGFFLFEVPSNIILHRVGARVWIARAWQLCAIYFFFIMGLYGVGFWLPTLIKGAGVSSPLTIGFLTVLPYATAAVGMVICGRLSDAAGERRWHIVVPGTVGAAGWLVSIWFAHDVVVAEIALTIATTGVLVTLAQFRCLPTALLAGAAAASGIAVINSVGNLAGFVSPYAIGWIIDVTHSTSLGVYTLAGCLLVGSLLCLTMPARLVNR